MHKVDIHSRNFVDINALKKIYTDIYSSLLKDFNEHDFSYFIIKTYTFFEKHGLLFDAADFFINPLIKVDLSELLYILNVCSNYTNIEINQDEFITCKGCDSTSIDSVDGEYICSHCGYIYDTRLPGIKDIEIPNKMKSLCNLKTNIIYAINRFEGVDVIISDEEFDMIQHTLMNRKINFKFLQKEHIYKVLKELKMTKYYDCINLILYKLNGTPIKRISHKTQEILNYHMELENVYQYIDKDRINSLNIYFKLYKFCQLCNLDVTLDDFSCMLKTEQKFAEHEQIWNRVCQYTHWK